MTERGARPGFHRPAGGKGCSAHSCELALQQLRVDPGTGQVGQLPVLPGVSEAPAGSLLQDCFDLGKATIVHEKNDLKKERKKSLGQHGSPKG